MLEPWYFFSLMPYMHVAKTTIVTDSVARMAVLVVVKSAITEMREWGQRKTCTG